MHRLEKRIAALEARLPVQPRELRTLGFFLEPGAEESEPRTVCNARGQEWRRRDDETAAEFIDRVKNEARSERDGIEGFYDRILTAVD